MRTRSSFIAGLLILLAASGDAKAQQVHGRAVHEVSRRGIRDLMVTLLDAGGATVHTVLTDTGGFFRMRTTPGVYTIVAQGLGFTPDRRTITVGATDLTLPAFVLRVEAVELDSVEARTRRMSSLAPVGFARAANVLSAEKLAKLDARGTTLLGAMRQFNGLHVRQMRDQTGHTRLCVESRRGLQPLRAETLMTRNRLRRTVQQIPCEWVVVIIDGLLTSDPEQLFRSQGLTDFESVEFASPVDAGSRYGMDASARGAIVIWTRGRGPHVDPARNGR